MKRRLILLAIVWVMLACQVVPTPPPLKPTPKSWLTPDAHPTSVPPAPQSSGATQPPGETSAPQTVPTQPPQNPVSALPPGELNLIPPADTQNFAKLDVQAWTPIPYAGVDQALPIALDQASNLGVATAFSLNQRAFLSQNGFVILHTQEPQFSSIRQQVSQRYGQPYYLTTDAAYYALHLTLDALLRALEREELRPRMIAITQGTLNELLTYLPTLQAGTPLEADTRQAAAYLGVALRLFNPQAELPSDMQGPVAAQVIQIMRAEGPEESTLFPGFQDDYSAYLPRGHYAGDPELEMYFRGMTWLQRLHFQQSYTEQGITSRLPLIVTLAMRRASSERGPVVKDWAAVEDVLTFLLGPTSESGPREYADLMDRVYGRSATLVSLEDNGAAQMFQIICQELPSPQADTTFTDYVDNLPSQPGWRFLSTHFDLDAYILRNLVFDKVSVNANKKDLPSGLDVMAALGSPAAAQALQDNGSMKLANYPEQLARLQKAAREQSAEQWLNSAFGAWMYAFLPQLAVKAEAYPPYMRTPAWSYKDLNSALGAWACIKHDSTLSLTPPNFSDPGSQPASGPAPGYVEPIPEVFYRLAYLANTIAAGLGQRGMNGSGAAAPLSLTPLLDGLIALGQRFQDLGKLADRELAGNPPGPEQYALIQDALGPVELLVQRNQPANTTGVELAEVMPPVPMITSIAGSGSENSQVGVGLVDRIYVIVPLEGKMQIAQGGVFSYYEFRQPFDEPLTDQGWQQLVLASPPPALQAWAQDIFLLNGAPREALAFRIGDVYMVTSAGNDLNGRAGPSRSAQMLRQLVTGEYVRIIEGPILAEGYTWWKIQVDLYAAAPVELWVTENPDWFVRAWGQ